MKLADRLAYGAGSAARRTGFLNDAYRPDGPACPIDLAKRFMRLAVTFLQPGGTAAAPAAFALPYRQALADWSYLQLGDYLVGPEGTCFVASIEPPKPMLVVMTNQTVSLTRPAAPVLPGLNAYGAVLDATSAVLLERFPACVLKSGQGGKTQAGLPDDTRVPGLMALLPVVAGVMPHEGDILLDAQGGRFSLTAAEAVFGVWRLSMVLAGG